MQKIEFNPSAAILWYQKFTNTTIQKEHLILQIRVSTAHHSESTWKKALFFIKLLNRLPGTSINISFVPFFHLAQAWITEKFPGFFSIKGRPKKNCLLLKTNKT